ncbi:MAG: glycosyltransferase family 9 protein [Chloroflexi bacterium]|nr:glycosyltransferase family 9 protein [Chloroflexota bacterium]
MPQRVRRIVRHSLKAAASASLNAVGQAQQAFVRRRRSASDLADIQRILVIRLDLIGDLVMSLPAIHDLRVRWPQAHITMLCAPGAAPIARQCGDIDTVLTFDPSGVRQLSWWLKCSTYREIFSLIRELRRSHFDIAFSLFGEFACLFAWASAAARRIGYVDEGYRALFTHPVPGRRYQVAPGALPPHEAQWNERLVEMEGAPPLGILPRLSVDGTAAQWWYEQRIRLGLQERRYLVLSLGAQNGTAKRYDPALWADVASTLCRRHGLVVVLTGNAVDEPLAAAFQKSFRGEVCNLIRRTSLDQLCAIIAGATLVLTGDSAPGHIAAAYGVPAVVAFGPTDPHVYRPYSACTSVTHVSLPCSPCYDLLTTAECRLGLREPLCMRLLPTAVLIEEAEAWLAKPLELAHRQQCSFCSLGRDRLVMPSTDS